MANTKISALTSATTPVAGTEVLPIVQTATTVKLAISDLTPGLSTITAAKGGTGQTSYAVGDLLYASTTSALSKLADVATGNALISGGVGVAPSYGKIGLTTHVSGVLPVANGGTNASSAGITAVPTKKNLSLDTFTGPVVPMFSEVIFLFFTLNLPTFPLTLLYSPTNISSSSLASFLPIILDSIILAFRRD